MSTTKLRVEPLPLADRPATPSKPVLVWAAFGALFTSVALVGWARWVTSDYFTPAPTGPDPFTGPKLYYLRAVEIGLFVVGIVLVWRYLVRPLIKERRHGFEGMLIVGFFFTWFYDPTVNANVFNFSYNHHFVNMGSWKAFIPFFNTPNLEQTAEPLLLIGGAYLGWFFLGPLLLGRKILRYFIERRRFSTLGAFAGLWLILALVETVFFVAVTVPELIQFPATIHSMSIFAGKAYQYPVYDCLLAPFLYCGYAALDHFRDDRGRSFVERGVDAIRAPGWVRLGLRQLAIAGFIQVLLLFGFLMPYHWFVQRADTAPKLKSYMNPGLCGAGTDYACPSEYVPIPRKGSLHIRPDDPRLPESVRSQQ